MERIVYVDNAATTKVSQRVINAMLPYFTENFGNASSIYSIGRNAKKALESARDTIANTIGAEAREIYFTSGGSEADNWAIKGICERLSQAGKKHIITSVFEHHAVLHTVEALEKKGFEVTYIKVDEKGLINPLDVKNAIREDTALVSIMYANNEIGTIQPIPEIGAICKEKGVLFHTDAVQAIGNVHINVKEQNIDLMSVSGHKIHAQKGVGFLYIRKGIVVPNLIHGGAQERNRRAGTENIPAIVGFAEAMVAANENIDEKVKRVTELRNYLIDGILKIPHTQLNGDKEKRLCGNLNISIHGIEGEALLLMLDMNGICASSGSACTSGSLDPSHVLLSIGLPHEIAHGSLRISLSEETTKEECDYILDKVPQIVERLRSMSPLWERMMKEENK